MLDREKIADDLLLGAQAIAIELKKLGLIKADDENAESKVFYIARKKKLPIGRFGKTLTASRAKLATAVRALVA
jgi:hypothetical protein